MVTRPSNRTKAHISGGPCNAVSLVAQEQMCSRSSTISVNPPGCCQNVKRILPNRTPSHVSSNVFAEKSRNVFTNETRSWLSLMNHIHIGCTTWTLPATHGVSKSGDDLVPICPTCMPSLTADTPIPITQAGSAFRACSLLGPRRLEAPEFPRLS